MPFLDRFRKAAPAPVETKSLASPEPWLFELFGASPTLAGISVSPFSAMQCAPVSCAVRAISETVSSLPVKTFKTTAAGRREEIDHPITRLLNEAPNSWQPAATFKRLMTMDCLLQPYGAFCQVIRVDGKVYELVRLDPRLSSIVVDYSNFEAAYAIKADGSSPKRTIPGSQILHFATPAYDPTRGLVGENRDTIALAIVLERFANQLFLNGARPSGIMSVPKSWVKDTLDKAKAAFSAAHSGTSAGGTAWVTDDMKFQQLMLNATDAQYIELRTYMLGEIARIFRVSLHLLMALEKNVSRSIEALGTEFLSFTLLPHLIAQQQEFTLKLLTVEERAAGVTIEYDTTHLVKADLAQRSQAFADAVSGRIMTPNEARDLGWSLGPVDGGDVLENPWTSSAYRGGKLNGRSNDNQNDDAEAA
ncbi:phage portal protein [Bradyrhizobium sp. CCBAU 51753]|uniref:phage portal protein n=1 Tax=Bradyrhizobium sp. CCBAU 51753 TaxID=1325100 RepID=UPI00188B073A|nr:phage portal protein [Bradyrhizobium sp. CCBAU 51753]QOZ26175.1 phage portal protein [Bradyrhizobium sp. CCBAU 51753]